MGSATKGLLLPVLGCGLAAALGASCGGDEGKGQGAEGGGGAGGGGGQAPGATEVVFDVGADLSHPEQFYDQPYPSDTRLTTRGTPDLTGFPYATGFTAVRDLRDVAMEHKGYPVVPVAYFRFTGPLPPQKVEEAIAAKASSPLLLVDIDADSDERGRLIPVVAATPEVDAYVPENLLAVAARPGFVLEPNRKYAFVVKTSLGDKAGHPLGVGETVAALMGGDAPEGPSGAALKTLFAPLLEALPMAGIEPADVAAATVFTTTDVVQDLFTLSSQVLAKHDVTLTNLHVDADDGADHPRFCELLGTVKMPQFQKGKAPFNTQGLFELDEEGRPVQQGSEDVPFTITLPNGEMPETGFPLVLYFHGSGGISSAIVDRGTWFRTTDASQCPEMVMDEWDGHTGCNTKGEGPAHVLAPFGFAMAASALPVNPERLPGASETAYLNFNNLPAGRDLFRQGVIEQRLFLEALTKIEIDPGVVAACAGVTLPAGADAFFFDGSHVFAQGQSMGGQYTNMMSAVEPRILASVPTGAGGYWSHFVMHTSLIDGIAGKIGAIILGTQAELSFLHPGLHVFETVWEPVDPMVYMPRLARRPLEGHPVRSIYEPVGLGDSYFPTETYDAMALAYGHREAGEKVWSSMQDALALEELDGIVSYPVKNDASSHNGKKYTGVIVQYEGDGLYDPHALYSQLDAVKHQVGCFLSTFLTRGTATVPAPAPLGTPCE